MARRKSAQPKFITSIIIAVALFIFLPLLVFIAYQQTQLSSSASTISGHPSRAGAGELGDITITYADYKFNISGPRVVAASNLVAYWPIGTHTNKVTFLKFPNGTFASTGGFGFTVQNFTTCADLETLEGSYLASFCLRNNNAAIYGDNIAFAPNPSGSDNVSFAPFEMRFFNNSSLNSVFFMTMPYDKTVTTSFRPTNFYMQAGGPFTLNRLEFRFKGTEWVACGSDAHIGIYPVDHSYANAIYFNAPRYGTVASCLFNAVLPTSVYFDQMDGKIISLYPGIAPINPTPSPSPTLIPTPTPTPTTCKTGVNSFAVNTACSGGFRYATYSCYDGFSGKLGGTTSCKSSEVWLQYVQQLCQGRSSCSVKLY